MDIEPSDRKPRARERDVLKLHRFLMREAEEPSESGRVGPWWLWAAVVLTVFVGGIYLGRHFGAYGIQAHLAYAPAGAPAVTPESAGAGANAAVSGETVYRTHCASCHQADGRGVPGAFPPLAGSEWVTGDSQQLVSVILNGLSGPITVAGQNYDGVMPAWKDQLGDAEIAAVATFIRQLGGNKAPPVEPAEVAKLRGGEAAGAQEPAAAPPAAAPAAALEAPPESSIPSGPMGEAIRYGEKVLSDTQTHAQAYVGNGLNCTSCHLNGGKTAYAAPWVGIWGVFPEYRSRNAQVNSLQDRVNDCFERSMNGKPLPLDSREMRGILAYMWWLSKGVPTGTEVEGRGFKRIEAPAPPNAERGKDIYAAKCASCHGADGQGKAGPKGEYRFPALWGPKSFNIGAGMARLNNAAGFVQANMPLGRGNTLTEQEAFDVAQYFIHQPRPDFPGKSQDWPKGDRPPDARY